VGTVPRDDADAVLLQGLAVAGDAQDLVRAFLLAFGETREPPDDDDVFDLGDRPWGEVGPAGLGVTIRREIDDAAAREALADALRSPDAETRRVAAVSLRHSLDSADALAAFEGALAAEADDVPASVLAESLVVQARRTREDETRARLVRGVIARTDGETFDATRFRIVDDLQHVALPQDVVDSLIGTLGAETPFARRVFALDVLAASAVESGTEVVTAVREQFVHLLETAADPAIRDACARDLRRLPAERSSSEALVRAVRGDAAWNVRYAALDTLADLKDDHLDLALDWAAKDDDARVRTRASEIESKRK